MNARFIGIASEQLRLTWRDNWLAFRLSPEFCANNEALLRPIAVTPREVLCEAGQAPSHVYFPIDCGTVQLLELKTGASTEISMTGCESLVNLELLFGASHSMWSTVVLNTGSVLRLPLKAVRDEFDSNAVFRAAVFASLQFRLFQTGQMAVCYQQHSIEQEICRWLLTAHDHIGGDVIHVTHQAIGAQMGLRREAVTVAALGLQNQHLIGNVRGSISIIDRGGLERRACECYHNIARERNRLRLKPAHSVPGPDQFRDALTA